MEKKKNKTKSEWYINTFVNPEINNKWGVAGGVWDAGIM